MPLPPDTLPEYVQAIVDAVPKDYFSHIRAANSSQYRYILNGDHHEVRLTQQYGIVVRRNPTQLNLRYAEHLPHSEVIARLQSDLQTNKVPRP
jgi:hypothetical protein